jgi:hypothetical protein
MVDVERPQLQLQVVSHRCEDVEQHHRIEPAGYRDCDAGSVAAEV